MHTKCPQSIHPESNRKVVVPQEVSKKYPNSIQQVSKKYPKRIQTVSQKYPKRIQQVSKKYPKSIEKSVKEKLTKDDYLYLFARFGYLLEGLDPHPKVKLSSPLKTRK